MTKTKEELIKAYKNLILKGREKNFTVLNICKEAGVRSKGTFYHYFESKEEILSLLNISLNNVILQKLDALTDMEISENEKKHKIFKVIIDEFYENYELISELNKYFKKRGRNIEKEGMKTLRMHYSLVYKKICYILFEDQSKSNLFKSKLALDIITLYFEEEYTNNFTSDTIQNEDLKELILSNAVIGALN